MASWNELREGEQLETCPVCRAQVSKRRRTNHLVKCYETYQDHMNDIGMMKCPLYPLHILPRKYLNHHLEGNCEEALNMLRKYFQKHSLKDSIKPAPAHFLADVPDSVLSWHNKNLLFILQRDLEGNIIKPEDFASNQEIDSPD